ncbi:MAG: shikimate dehydrogenase family protein, partial [Vicinamibacteria bacterium]
ILVALTAQGAKEIRLVNRTRDTADALARELGGPIKVVPWDERAHALADASTLINATTQGSAGKTALDLPLDTLPRDAIVGDAIYVPPETPLLAAAKARGNRTVNGLGMLLNQARPAFQAWFGPMPTISPGLKRAIAATFRPWPPPPSCRCSRWTGASRSSPAHRAASAGASRKRSRTPARPSC